MAAKKKKKKRSIRQKPLASDLASAKKSKGEPNPRVGLKETPFRMRRSFRDADDKSVQTIWDWYVTGFFTQAELADRFGLTVSAVGAMCRCMPTTWGRKR